MPDMWEGAKAYFGGVAKVGLGSVGVQAIALLAAPILTRLYSPPDFGVGAAFAAVYSWVVVVASLRFEKSILLARTNSGAERFTRLALGATVPVSLLVGILSGAAVLLGAHPVFLLLPVTVLLGGSSRVVLHWLTANRHFGSVSRLRLRQSIASVISQIVFALLGAGAFGISLGQTMGLFLGAASPLRALAGGRSADHRLNMRALLRSGLRIRSLPLISAPSTLVNNAGLYLPVVLIGGFFGAAAAGYFALAQRLIGIPMQTVGDSIGQAYAGAFSKVKGSEQERIFWQSVALLAGVAVCAWAVAALVVRSQVVVLVFGPAFAPSEELIIPLAVAGGFQLVSSPVSQTILLRRRFGIQFGWDTLRASLVLGALLVANYRGMTIVDACWTLAVVSSVSYVLSFFVSVLLLRDRRFRDGVQVSSPPV